MSSLLDVSRSVTLLQFGAALAALFSLLLTQKRVSMGIRWMVAKKKSCSRISYRELSALFAVFSGPGEKVSNDLLLFLKLSPQAIARQKGKTDFCRFGSLGNQYSICGRGAKLILNLREGGGEEYEKYFNKFHIARNSFGLAKGANSFWWETRKASSSVRAWRGSV